MAKESEKKECCSGHPSGLRAGFNFGFGFWSAGLLVSTIVTLVAILIWYISTII